MMVTAPRGNDSICSSTSFISGSVSASRVLPARRTTTATPAAGRCCWNCKFRSPVMKTSNRSCRILSSNSPFVIPLQPIRCTDVQKCPHSARPSRQLRHSSMSTLTPFRAFAAWRPQSLRSPVRVSRKEIRRGNLRSIRHLRGNRSSSATERAFRQTRACRP